MSQGTHNFSSKPCTTISQAHATWGQAKKQEGIRQVVPAGIYLLLLRNCDLIVLLLLSNVTVLVLAFCILCLN